MKSKSKKGNGLSDTTIIILLVIILILIAMGFILSKASMFKEILYN
jgi:hypothetical protein